MNKLIAISLLVAVFLIGGALVYISRSASSSANNQIGNEIKIIDGARPEIIEGRQIIEISVKGGYYPRRVVAKAGIPTVLRIKTNGTFDCSSSLFIPKLNYHKLLASSGVEDIEISASKASGVLRGLCGMGMYNFEVVFE